MPDSFARRPPKISVVLPTYNRARTVTRSVESALAQTFRDFEILVIDDGSTDDTEGVLRTYREWGLIRYIGQPHRNAAAARNRGIRESRGAYIAFLDSDDEWVPEKLKKQIAILEGAAATTGVVYCDMLRLRPGGRTWSFTAPDVQSGETFSPRTRDYQFRGVGIQASLFRRQCFDEGRLFDENLFAFCDLELFLRISEAFDFHHLREPLVRYYSGPGISTDMAAIADAREYMLMKYAEHFVRKPRYLAFQYAKIAAARYLAGDVRSSREYALKAIKLDPLNLGVILRSLPAMVGLRFPAGAYRQLLRFLPASWDAK